MPKKRKPRKYCEWREDKDGAWDTSCKNKFELTHGTPLDNQMTYCCYCGKPLGQIARARYGDEKA